MIQAKTTAISLRVDNGILAWFRSNRPRGYQTLMHAVLRGYVEEQKKRETRLAGRAQEIFFSYYTQCFWHYDKKLVITPSNMHIVVDGLRKYGGRKGLVLAEELCQ
ncbi:BrnA antitoxin family protein [Oligoflexia bacterium]|nr:BrnA antitoxin family protein [Oligoflexia bacterium]